MSSVPPPSVGDRFAAATRPPLADRYAIWWKVWLPIPLLLLVLDVSFNAWFWRLPKLTGSAADYSYQYLYDLANLRGTKQEDVPRIVAFGSSVSSAFDPYQVRGLLAARGIAGPVEVSRLTKPGSKPSDHRLVWHAELDAVQPDVAVFVFNLVDFLNPSFERNLKPDIRAILPPWQTLRERWRYISDLRERLSLVAAGVSNLYRYRQSIQSAFEDNAKALDRWLLSDDGSGGSYGWYEDGFTRDRFAVPVPDPASATFEYFVHPAWLQQRGSVRLSFSIDGRPLATRDVTTPGWKSLPLDGVGSGLLQGIADSTWSPRAAGLGNDTRLLGVQLRATPPTSLNHGQAPFRYAQKLPADIDDFLRMGFARGDAYADTWQAMLQDGSEYSRRFGLYRDFKLATRARRFEPTGEFAELRALVEELTAAGVSVVLVNTPESPLLAGVTDSDFYRGYLQFFRDLARDNSRLRFVDLHDAIPAEDLNDWHHVNYIGQIKLGPVFASVLEEEVARRQGEVGEVDNAL